MSGSALMLLPGAVGPRLLGMHVECQKLDREARYTSLAFGLQTRRNVDARMMLPGYR